MQDSNGGMKSSAAEMKTSYLFMNRRNQFHVVYGFNGGFKGGGVSADDVLIAIRGECEYKFSLPNLRARTFTRQLVSGSTSHTSPSTSAPSNPFVFSSSPKCERSEKQEWRMSNRCFWNGNQRRLPFANLQWNVMLLMPSAGDSAETTVGGYSITVVYCCIVLSTARSINEARQNMVSYRLSLAWSVAYNFQIINEKQEILSSLISFSEDRREMLVLTYAKTSY